MTIHYPSLSYTHTRTGHVLWLLNFFEALHLKFVLFCANGVSVIRGLEHIYWSVYSSQQVEIT